MKYFYSSFIEVESLVVRLDELQLVEDQRIHLAELIDSLVHNAVLDVILSQLDQEGKEAFLKMLEEDSQNDQVLQFLQSKIDNLEEQIQSAVMILKEEFYEDLKEAKRIS